MITAARDHPRREPDGPEETSFRPVFLILVGLSILPLWVSRYLPMVDLPQHLALINIFHHLDDPDLPFGRFFDARPGFTPYLGYYWTLHLISYLVPLEIANRLFLTAYASGLAGATLALVRALGKSRWLALFSLPLIYTFEFHIGFVSYLAALALLVAALALYAVRLQGRLTGRGWDLLLVALPAACLATHPQPYAFFAAGLAVMIAAFPGRRLATFLRALPSLLLFAWWLRPLLGGGATAPALTAGARSDPFPARLSGVGGYLLDQFTDRLDSAILLGFAALWIWVMAAALRGPAEEGAWREAWVSALLAGGAIAAYLLMPTHMDLMQFIHPRYATLACLLLAVAVPLAPGKAPGSWRLALVALCAAHSIYLIAQFRRFDAEAGDFRALAARVEPKSCVGAIAGYMDTGVLRDPGAYVHFAGYVSLWRGAVPGYTFAYTRHSPIAYRKTDGSIASGARDAALPQIGPRAGLIPPDALYAAYGDFYRYFLIPAARDPADLFGSNAGRLARLGASGPLALYFNPAGRCGE